MSMCSMGTCNIGMYMLEQSSTILPMEPIESMK